MRFKAGYDFKKGNIYASYGDLTQKLASTRVNVSCVGFVEPFFPELLGTEVVKGSIKDASLGVNYEFANKLKANLGLYRYYITRNAQINPANQMNLHQNVGSLNLVYPLNRFCDFGAGYSLINYRGLYVDQTQQGFTQGIFNLSAS